MDNRPIGLFDSGLGGLTVLKEISHLLPHENLIYFGDCARIPYGTKSKETVIKYVFQNIRFLLSFNVKLIVFACNTASAYAFKEAKSMFDVNMIEVINPGAKAALDTSINKKIAVIGTPATINSNVYEKTLKSNDQNVSTYSVACPLFVPLVEEGWWEDEITQAVAQRYLLPLHEKGVDALVLGCTHYPLLANVIQSVMGDSVALINSAKETAKQTKAVIMANGMERGSENMPEHRFYTSDSVDKFKTLSTLFLGTQVNEAYKVDIEKY